uniref:Uncharacterized protein n=1 Tax=Anopheles marajoara TaxID=58244 RepID=A0A2M4BYW6_9DIPT
MMTASPVPTCFAHFLLAAVTGWALKHTPAAYGAPFASGMLLFLLAHSLVGILRFAHPQPHQRLRQLYERSLLLSKVCGLPLLNTQLYLYHLQSSGVEGFGVTGPASHTLLRYAFGYGFLLSAAIAFLVGCAFSELAQRHLVDHVATAMLLINGVALCGIATITLNYWAIGLVLSSVGKHFVLHRLVERFSVPFIDLHTYGLIFYEIFAVNAVLHLQYYPRSLVIQ